MISFSSSGSSSALITSCGTNDCWNWPVLTYWGRNNLHLEISVQNEIVIFCWAVADWAGPCGFLLVHHQEQGGVETLNVHMWAVHFDLVSVSETFFYLEMITSGWSTWHRHPHLSKRAAHRHLSSSNKHNAWEWARGSNYQPSSWWWQCHPRHQWASSWSTPWWTLAASCP